MFCNNKFSKIFVLILLVLIKDGQGKKKDAATKDDNWGSPYDFIVIGAGTAGSVLASRLSEVKKWKILVLEAGDKPNLISKIPALAPTLQLSHLSWIYKTEPQKNIFKGIYANTLLWSSGKCLGGTSTINNMVYVRGNPEDYNNWEKSANISNWSYKDNLPYFLKSERVLLEYFDQSYHGTRGLLHVEHSYVGEEAVTFFKAAKELGYDTTDYNGENQIGFSTIQANLDKGGRQSAYNAFIEPVLERPNLEIVKQAHATKIFFDQKTKKAKSVKFLKNGNLYRATALKEIIVCSGAFNSPLILLLSGIGPKKDLQRLSVRPLISDLPVGQGLRDHFTYPGLNFITNSNKSQMSVIKDFVVDLPFWYLSGKGILSSVAGFEAIGFVKFPNSSKNQRKPDVQVMFLNSNFNRVARSVFNIKTDLYKQLYNKTEEKISWSIYPILLHTKSRGYVKLRTKNPLDAPILQPNFLTDRNDIKNMIEAIRFVLKMAQTSEFRRVNATLNPNPIPGCEKITPNSDEYWECALRTLGVPAYDPFGTCKMAAKSKGGVVDSKLKVYGVQNLRVVDASVIPDTISGNLLAPTVMIAERAADFIKDDYNHV